ncbi:MAG: hypothetical protein PVF58_04935 [Candidatus Methanofastidiosia archaeon]|jgi:hypothetical protein
MSEKYKHPVYRAEGKAQRFTLRQLKEMGTEELLEELKDLCESKN